MAAKVEGLYSSQRRTFRTTAKLKRYCFLLLLINKLWFNYASLYLLYIDIIDFKVSQVSMKLVIGSCSKCLYHFVANLLTKDPHKILCKSADLYGRCDKK